VKKQVAQLSKPERENIEASYHEMNPQEFDDIMSRASKHTGVKPRIVPEPKPKDALRKKV
jgi:hypothetical protein